MVTTVSGVVAPVVAAMAYDALGSYTLSFTVLAVLAALGSVFLLLLPPPSTRRPGDPAPSEEAAFAH